MSIWRHNVRACSWTAVRHRTSPSGPACNFRVLQLSEFGTYSLLCLHQGRISKRCCLCHGFASSFHGSELRHSLCWGGRKDRIPTCQYEDDDHGCHVRDGKYEKEDDGEDQRRLIVTITAITIITISFIIMSVWQRHALPESVICLIPRCCAQPKPPSQDCVTPTSRHRALHTSLKCPSDLPRPLLCNVGLSFFSSSR